jgi:hypothetical protein
VRHYLECQKLKRAIKSIRLRIRQFWSSLQSELRIFRINSVCSRNYVVAHVLVVKNLEYVKVAKVCVESFLVFNPETVVIIHVDLLTEKSVRLKFKRLINKGRVSIILVKNYELKWQIQKIELICSLSGSDSIFMDADLKWNGPLPAIQGTTFFVNEFLLDENEDYKYLLKEIFKNKTIFGPMKNTSFFTWGGYELSEFQKKRIREIEQVIVNHLAIQDKVQSKYSGLNRMSEQLALSLAVEEFPAINVTYLKSEDGFKDGSFVESSYFGATGATFN